MWIIILIVAFAALIGISIFISNLQNRAMQHVMKGTPLSQSNINKSIYGSFGEKHMEKYLADHPEETADSVKTKFMAYADALLHKNAIPEFSSSVSDKISNDQKLEKLSTMEFKNFNLIGYSNSMLNLQFTYSDGKDEYHLILFCKPNGDTYIVDKYRIDKGAVVGF